MTRHSHLKKIVDKIMGPKKKKVSEELSVSNKSILIIPESDDGSDQSKSVLSSKVLENSGQQPSIGVRISDEQAP